MFFSIIKLFFVNLIIFPIILNAMIENGQNSQYDQEIILENYNKEHYKEMIDILTNELPKEITEKETLNIVEELINNAYNINKNLYDSTNEFINKLEEEQFFKFEEDLKNYLKNNKLNKKKKKQKEKKIQTNLDDEELNILQQSEHSFDITPNDQSMRTMINKENNLVNGQIERRRSLSDINDNVLKRIARSKNLNTSHSRRTNALTFLATPGRIFNSRNKNSNNSSFLNRSGRALRKFFSRN
ncbi:hypothetical protein Mgra_00009500 [Meloidogyne graminicola]|uniref:Uncharacterized protein n=1 Tax=Meloidogyne graminicola TaxID=189291 RepID=A0A8S9Z969_9BILA|nr:hypothetical protein Mgra_00009500 [Meloidogyne graminicola]